MSTVAYQLVTEASPAVPSWYLMRSVVIAATWMLAGSIATFFRDGNAGWASGSDTGSDERAVARAWTMRKFCEVFLNGYLLASLVTSVLKTLMWYQVLGSAEVSSTLLSASQFSNGMKSASFVAMLMMTSAGLQRLIQRRAQKTSDPMSSLLFRLAFRYAVVSCILYPAIVVSLLYRDVHVRVIATVSLHCAETLVGVILMLAIRQRIGNAIDDNQRIASASDHHPSLDLRSARSRATWKTMDTAASRSAARLPALSPRSASFLSVRQRGNTDNSNHVLWTTTVTLIYVHRCFTYLLAGVVIELLVACFFDAVLLTQISVPAAVLDLIRSLETMVIPLVAGSLLLTLNAGALTRFQRTSRKVRHQAVDVARAAEPRRSMRSSLFPRRSPRLSMTSHASLVSISGWSVASSKPVSSAVEDSIVPSLPPLPLAEMPGMISRDDDDDDDDDDEADHADVDDDGTDNAANPSLPTQLMRDLPV